MMNSPKILICDEPTTGLDPLLKKHMWHLIKQIASRGTTVLVSSHILSDIENFCTRVAILHKGVVLEVDAPDKLKEMYSKDQEIHLETFPGKYDLMINEIMQHKELAITYIANKGHKLVIYTPQAESVLHTILLDVEKMGEQLIDLDVNRPTLEEVFEALTSREGVQGITEKEIYDYVRESFEYGYTRQQIAQALGDQRWPQDMIVKVLDDVQKEEEEQ